MPHPIVAQTVKAMINDLHRGGTAKSLSQFPATSLIRTLFG
jgi:hypothetical protein